MVFDWKGSHLEPGDVYDLVNSRKGLIPVDIDIENKKLIWLDVAAYHFSDSFFFVSVEKLLNQDLLSCATDLSILDSDSIVADTIYPSGFIFHLGRCGSTLIAKALA